MAKVTYRGQVYDTESRRIRPIQQKKVVEVYRGIKHDETVRVAQ